MESSPDVSPLSIDGADRPIVRRLSRKISSVIQHGQRDTKQFVRKPRNLVAVGLFFVMVSRILYNHVKEYRLTRDLMASSDLGKDQLLNSGEMTKFFNDNGLDIREDQVRKLFGRVDSEGNGFDKSELRQIVKIVSDLPAASERIQSLAANSNSVILDALLIIASGAGLYYLVMHSDAVEKKWAASSFHNAVQYRRMQDKCSKLDANLEHLCKERHRLEQEIKSIEESCSGDLSERDRQLRALNLRLEEVRNEQDQTRWRLEKEVTKWQQEAEKNIREASMTSKKMERMMTCVKGLGTCLTGLEAFSGTGTGEFNSLGAQTGFSHVQRSIGFSMDSITFGTIENDARGHQQLRLYETSSSRKIGEGRDSAYSCCDLTSGQEYALKMYKIHKKEQRRAIYNDLYAHFSQVGKHPRIVSYEKVIESESNIFVLMELIAGKDLFDIVASQQLSEAEVRPLFTELVEGLQHLHANGVIHCDVKPENAMVQGDIAKGTAHLKLIDFGCSCFKKYENDIDGCIVWDTYMPPEHSANPKLKPDVATDMWRLGCLLYVMLMRRPPFHNNAETRWGREARELSRFCMDPPFETLSSEAKDLISCLIKGEPSKRPTTTQVLGHPWLRGGTQN